MTVVLDERVLAHHGVKGQKWGVVRDGKVTGGASKISRASQRDFLRTEKKRINSSGKESRKQFKSDVKSVKSKEGVAGRKSQITGIYSGKSGEETSLFTGKFVNNKDQKVSEEYANVVLHEAMKKQDFKRRVVSGAAMAVVILASVQH